MIDDQREEQKYAQRLPELHRHIEELETTVNCYKAKVDDLTRLSQEITQLRDEGTRLELFRTLIDQTNDEIFVLSPESGRLLDVNERACSMLGYTREELLTMSVIDIDAVISDIAIWKQHVKEVMEKGAVVLESRHRRKDGAELDTEINVKYIKGENSDYMVAIARDISRRKQREALLQEQKEFIANVIYNSAVPMFVIDTEHRVLHWNRACEELTGNSASEVIGTGRHCEVFYKDIPRPCLADFVIEGKREDISRFYEQHGPSQLIPEGHHAEGWFEDLGGRRRYILFDAAPLYNREGQLIAATETLQDITDLKSTEEALEKAKKEWEETFNLVPDLILITDKQFRIVKVNKHFADKLGKPLHEILGKRCYQVVDGTQEPPPYCPHRSLLADGKPHSFDIHRESLGGDFLASVVPLLDSEGKFSGSVISYRDITDRKRGERLLKEARERLEYLLTSSPAMIYSALPFGEFPTTFISENVKEQLGYDPEEFIGNPKFWSDHVHPEDLPRLDAEMAHALEREEYALEYRFLHKNGDYIWVHDEAKLVRDTDGTPFEIVGYWINITERKRVESAREELIRQQEAILNNIPDMAWLKDKESRFIAVNDAFANEAGIRAEELVGKTDFDAWPHDLAEKYRDDDKEVMETGRRKQVEEHLVDRNGRKKWIETIKTPIYNETGDIIGTTGIARDITDRKEMEETIRRQAYHDVLTGLPNRMLFIDHLALALNQAHRPRHMFSVMFLDLDRFKTINDSLGHAVGDQLLQAVAYRLRTCLREGDTVARMGGDEYTILLPRISSEEDALRIAQKIVAAFRQPFVIDEHELHMTTSIGISLYPNDGDSVDALMQNADTAMYHAKQQGRNAYKFYNPQMNLHAYRRLLMEDSLRKALENGGLTVFYQPQMDIASGAIIGIEALVRWQHPELGLLAPAQFIPLAEETGLIIDMGERVLRAACKQSTMWQMAGFKPVTLTVNLSGRQFMQPDFVEMVSRILDETSLDSCYLNLEITERIAMQDINGNLSKMTQLGERGVQFSLDDFGTGCLSLSRLTTLPIQKMKIDRSFISELGKAPGHATLVNAMITMGHSLNMRVAAEGVETAEQLSFLQSKHCDEMQGYLVSQPLPPEEAGRFMVRTAARN